MKVDKFKDFENLSSLIAREGECRKNLFPTILSPAMESLYNKCAIEFPGLGIKVCGAGGGGCFILTHDKSSKASLHSKILKEGFKLLQFSVEGPQI